MKEKLIRLYNTMSTIETKGQSTKAMAVCMTYVEQMINECVDGEDSPKESVE